MQRRAQQPQRGDRHDDHHDRGAHMRNARVLDQPRDKVCHWAKVIIFGRPQFGEPARKRLYSRPVLRRNRRPRRQVQSRPPRIAEGHHRRRQRQNKIGLVINGNNRRGRRRLNHVPQRYQHSPQLRQRQPVFLLDPILNLRDEKCSGLHNPDQCALRAAAQSIPNARYRVLQRPIHMLLPGGNIR